MTYNDFSFWAASCYGLDFVGIRQQDLCLMLCYDILWMSIRPLTKATEGWYSRAAASRGGCVGQPGHVTHIYIQHLTTSWNWQKTGDVRRLQVDEFTVSLHIWIKHVLWFIMSFKWSCLMAIMIAMAAWIYGRLYELGTILLIRVSTTCTIWYPFVLSCDMEPRGEDWIGQLQMCFWGPTILCTLFADFVCTLPRMLMKPWWQFWRIYFFLFLKSTFSYNFSML